MATRLPVLRGCSPRGKAEGRPPGEDSDRSEGENASKFREEHKRQQAPVPAHRHDRPRHERRSGDVLVRSPGLSRSRLEESHLSSPSCLNPPQLSLLLEPCPEGLWTSFGKTVFRGFPKARVHIYRRYQVYFGSRQDKLAPSDSRTNVQRTPMRGRKSLRPSVRW